MFVPDVRGGVARDRAALHEVEAADLVEPEDVIRVAVREEHRVHARDAVRQRLLPQIGRGVHQDRRAARHVHVDRRAQPLVARIGRTGRPRMCSRSSARRTTCRCRET